MYFFTLTLRSMALVGCGSRLTFEEVLGSIPAQADILTVNLKTKVFALGLNVSSVGVYMRVPWFLQFNNGKYSIRLCDVSCQFVVS